MNLKTEFKTSDLDKFIIFKVPTDSAIVRVVVNLKGQEIGFEGMEAMSTTGFSKFKGNSLESININLQGNEISDDGLSLFSEKVLNMQAQLKKLKLILVGNDLTKKGCILLAEKGLSLLPNLVSLYLDFNWNDIGDDGLMTLVKSGLNKTLVNFYLNLEWNEISQKAFEYLVFKGIKDLNFLTKCQLVLLNNNISEEGIKNSENLIRKITKERLSRVLMIITMKERLKDTPKIYNDIIPQMF